MTPRERGDFLRLLDGRRPIATPAFTYFIQCSGSGLIKIGCAVDPYERKRTLQTGTPYFLSMVRVESGGREREAELHRRFAHLRVSGEWFRRDGELADYLSPVESDTASVEELAAEYARLTDEAESCRNFAEAIQRRCLDVHGAWIG